MSKFSSFFSWPLPWSSGEAGVPSVGEGLNLGKAHTDKVECRGKGSVSGEQGLDLRKKAGGGGSLR